MLPVLHHLSIAIKDAPHLTQVAANELKDITLLLGQLQTYIVGKAKASLERLSLITVEHITTTLTSCVLTYSELDALLKSPRVNKGLGAWDRARWLLKKDEMYTLISRLQNHRSMLGLMLNVPQCASLGEAEANMDRLCETVNQVLQSNHWLSMRLCDTEDTYIRQVRSSMPTFGSAMSSELLEIFDQLSLDLVADDSDLSSHSRSSEARAKEGELKTTSQINGLEYSRVSAFEELLHRSHVYRHAAANHSESSLTVMPEVL